MRGLIQRVLWAEVQVEDRIVGQIGKGLLVYVGIAPGDTVGNSIQLAAKIANLRIFPDEQGMLNRSVRDVRGGVLAVSNFTLLADARKGRRPSFATAAPAEVARPLHEAFLTAMAQEQVLLAGGIFGASMIIRSAADGPVNLVLDVPALQESCSEASGCHSSAQPDK